MARRLIVYGMPTCPKTNLLKHKLEQAGYEVEFVTDILKIMEEGIQSTPKVKYNDELLTYKEAVENLLGVSE